MTMDALENSKMASASAQLKLKDPGQMSLSHALKLSDNPTKHAPASSMIRQDVAGFIPKDIELLYAAVKNDAFSVIETLLKKAPLDNYYQCRHIIGLAMRSQNSVRLLTLFFKCKRDVTLYCENLPWDMSDDHLATVVKTLMRLASLTDESAVGQILEFVSSKNPKLAKDLLNSKTKTNEKLYNLKELLFSSLKLDKVAVTDFLLREGADVNGYVDNDKRYPLHFACRSQNLGTTHLFLQLGADVNVTDRFGNTPFSMIFVNAGQEHDCVFTAKIMAKHFACLISTGKTVNQKDLLVIRNKPKLQKFFDSCIAKLNKMKSVQAADGLSHHCFFSKSSYKLSLLMKNPKIFNQLRRSLLSTETNGFTVFKTVMMTKFGIARQTRIILASRERELEEIFSENLPSIVLRDIARFSLDFKQLEKDYHLTKSSWYYKSHFSRLFQSATI